MTLEQLSEFYVLPSCDAQSEADDLLIAAFKAAEINDGNECARYMNEYRQLIVETLDAKHGEQAND